ncbi:MAG TPA: hypothetical protein VFZ40_18295 [Pyrinomonadaceae bacterium]
MPGIAATFCLLLMLGSVFAQSNNLVKNANGDEGTKFWRVFGNASVSEHASLGKRFSINQDAFLFQDIDVPASTAGMYAVFISLASIDHLNSNKLGSPYTHGYFMTAGDLRNASLLANLAGQEMTNPPTTNGEWVKQFGVFRVPEQTGRIRIFLRGGCGKSESSVSCVSHFRKPGVFLFGSEEEAKAFVESYE